MIKKGVVTLLVIALLSSSLLAGEGPRGPLCNPFRPSVENHMWFWWPEGIAGFEFADDGTLLYIVDGVPSQFGELISTSVQAEFQKLPFSGEFTSWYPVKEGGLGGFWLKHYAVRLTVQPWGFVFPGVDYLYTLPGGTQITEFKKEDFRYYRDQPFDTPREDYVWKIEDDELYGVEFDRKGVPRYLVHGIPGTYSLDDAPLSGEYTVWYPLTSKGKEGYWLKHTAVREFRMLWGRVTPGVDLNFSSVYNLKDLTKKSLTKYTDDIFNPEVKNSLWKNEKNHLHGFEFDERGTLLYIIDSIPGKYSLDDVPYSGQYTVWRSTSTTEGYWLKYTAVKKVDMPWGKVYPGIDYNYEGGKSIKNLSKSSQFTFEPFADLKDKPQNHIWKRKGDVLYGAQFDDKGHLLYLILGTPGTYSLNDVPLSGEYVVWLPVKDGKTEGFWLKYIALSEYDMEWGPVNPGIDFYYTIKGGYRISGLTRDHYNEGWDIRIFLKYFWDIYN
ncbi:MAG: hypothetical protein HXS54_09235 [Theionarchaea archaeon]|nr:hypothetical protein [Theionarchaea archaeon]